MPETDIDALTRASVPDDWTELDRRAVDTVRVLAADAVQKVGNGHPGTAMSLAPLAYLLFQKRHAARPRPTPTGSAATGSCSPPGTPASPSTSSCTSAATAWSSTTSRRCAPGAARPRATRSTGTPPASRSPPARSGRASAPRSAWRWPRAASAACSTRTPRWARAPFDHQIYVIASDGDIEEGVTSEASSLAGTQQLGNLTVIYDDNQISIEDDTDDRAEPRTPRKRYEAYGWHVQTSTRRGGENVDGQSSTALETARAETDRPSFILLRTIIAWPGAQRPEHRQGARLRARRRRGRARSRRCSASTPTRPSRCRTSVLAHARKVVERGQGGARGVDRRCTTPGPPASPSARSCSTGCSAATCPIGWEKALPSWDADKKGVATRKASGEVLNAARPTCCPSCGAARPTWRRATTPRWRARTRSARRRSPRRCGTRSPTAASCTSASASTRWARSSTASRCTAPPAPTAAPSSRSATTCAAPVRLAALMKVAGHLRLDARLDRPRRGRPDPPADRAPGRAAGDPGPRHRAPRRRQRDRVRLEDDPREPRGPQGDRADPPEHPRPRGHVRRGRRPRRLRPRRRVERRTRARAHRHRLGAADRRRRPRGAGGRRHPHPGRVDAVHGLVRGPGPGVPRLRPAADGEGPGLGRGRDRACRGAGGRRRTARSSRSSTTAPAPTTRRLFREFGFTTEHVVAAARTSLDRVSPRSCDRHPRPSRPADPARGATMAPDERLAALSDGGRVHLARRPVPRAPRQRQPARADHRQERRRRHHQPDDLRGRAGERARRTTRRSASSADRGASVEDTVREVTVGDVQQACDVFSGDLGAHRRRRRPGLARGRARCSRTTPRRPSPRRWTCGRPSTGPTCWSRSRPPRRACRRSPRALAEGVSVNVTLIFSVERYRDVMDGLPGRASSRPPRTGRPGRHRLGGVASSSPASTPRSTSGWRRSARTRRWRCAARPASRTPGSPTRPSRRSSRARAGPRSTAQGAKPAAAAVGLDRGEEPRLLRHHVRHRAGRRRHRQHDAGEDPAGVRRPRRGRGRPVTGTAAQAQEVFDALERVGVDLTDVFRTLEDEGVEKFEQSWRELLDTVKGQLDAAT